MADNLVAAGNYYGFVFDSDKPLRDLGTVERDLLYFGVYSQRFIRHFPEKTLQLMLQREGSREF